MVVNILLVSYNFKKALFFDTLGCQSQNLVLSNFEKNLFF